MSAQNNKKAAKKGKTSTQEPKDKQLKDYFRPDKSDSTLLTSNISSDHANMAAMMGTDPPIVTFELLKQLLDKQTKDICDTVSLEIKAISSRIDGIEEAVAMQDSEISGIKQAMKALEDSLHKEISECERKWLEMSCYSRRRNLLLYGINQTPEEDITEAVRNFFTDSLGIDDGKARNMLFVNAHRLPRMPKPDGSVIPGPVPIIVKFVSMFAARQKDIFPDLKERKQSVQTDLPAVLKQKHGRLALKVKELRKSGLMACITEANFDVFITVKKSAQSRWTRYEDDP